MLKAGSRIFGSEAPAEAATAQSRQTFLGPVEGIVYQNRTREYKS